MTSTRRLAAIAVADVVGYSRLMEADEAGTLAALKERRRTILEPVVRAHGGRIVKVMGDGVLIEFASAVNAVKAALELQGKMAQVNEALPENRRIVLRIGINLGDVIGEGADIYGEGVNIAARIEALARPGGICIAAKVHDEVRGKVGVAFEDAGEQVLKNIARPVRVWHLREASEIRASGADLPLPERPSIAVLPFDNLSGQPDEVYFSDGITEDIITGLAKFRSLFVVARNSSFAFRGKAIDLVDIGRKLGVSYLLEGSIRRAGNRVRITAQLIEAATGLHLWAERYDRGLEDIFAVQEEVSRTIVSTLVGRIQDARLQQSLRKPTASLAAYDCLLRGLAHFRGYADDDNQKAHEMFERAVALDPQYALAHANLASSHLALNGNAAAPPTVLDRAFAMASHALDLDPQESNCHRVLALIWLYRRDHDAAEHHYRRAVELNPNDADRCMGLGYLLALRGKLDEALAWMQEAMRLNPFHPTWYNARLGVVLFSLRRYAEAAQAFRRIPNPGYWSRARVAACYVQLGQAEEAALQVAAILQEKPDFSIAGFFHRDVLLEREEDRAHLREGLLKAGLPE